MAKKEEVQKAEEPVKPEDTQVMIMIYALYKANFLTRLDIKSILRIIKSTDPTINITEYLVKESQR